MPENDNISTGATAQILPISEAEEQFYLNHPDHGVRAEFVARRLAQPGSDRRGFSDFVHRVQEGIDHDDV